MSDDAPYDPPVQHLLAMCQQDPVIELMVRAMLQATPAQMRRLQAIDATADVERYALKRWILEVLGDDDEDGALTDC